MTLSPVEQRVLGSLIEKEIATPESYPLSLNALLAACNQRSSRDPVMVLTEEDLRQALHRLEDLELVTALRDARVPKWEHRARFVLQLRRDEIAVLCLLLLRGPQTPGELRSRADRLYTYTDLDAVVGTLDRLSARAAEHGSQEPEAMRPLVAILPRQPGAREQRYRHLLGETAERAPATGLAALAGNDADLSPATQSAPPALDALANRLRHLERRVAALEAAGSANQTSDDTLSN